MNFIHASFELRFAAHDNAQIALFRRLEGIQRRGVGLSDKTRRADAVIKHYHNAAALRFRVGRHGHRFQQIHRTVGTDGRGRTHCRRENDRLIAFTVRLRK